MSSEFLKKYPIIILSVLARQVIHPALLTLRAYFLSKELSEHYVMMFFLVPSTIKVMVLVLLGLSTLSHIDFQPQCSKIPRMAEVERIILPYCVQLDDETLGGPYYKKIPLPHVP